MAKIKGMKQSVDFRITQLDRYWHQSVLHDLESIGAPAPPQVAPPFAGAGLLQDLVRVVVGCAQLLDGPAVEHEWLHGPHALHALYPPSIGVQATELQVNVSFRSPMHPLSPGFPLVQFRSRVIVPFPQLASHGLQVAHASQNAEQN